MITYKGFKGTIRYDKFKNTYYGIVEGITDIIMYEGKNLYLLTRAFHQSIDKFKKKLLTNELI